MHRRDREVTSMPWIEEVLRSAGWLTLALCGPDGFPHAAPLPFVYEAGRIVAGGVEEDLAELLGGGTKCCCFQVVTGVQVIRHDSAPSKFSMMYKSVTGYGEARVFTDDCGSAKKIEVNMKGVTGKTNGYQVSGQEN